MRIIQGGGRGFIGMCEKIKNLRSQKKKTTWTRRMTVERDALLTR